MVSHSVTQKSNPTQTAPASSGTWAVWMYQDCFGYGFVAQPDSESSAALRDGFAFVESNLTLEEACQMRDDLKSGALTLEDIAAAHSVPDDVPEADEAAGNIPSITRHGMVIGSEFAPKPAPVTEAAYIRDFNWSYVRQDANTLINGVLYRPVFKAGKKTHCWHARAHVFATPYTFWLYLTEYDIAFLERTLAITIGHKSYWFDEPLHLQVVEASDDIKCGRGIRRILLDKLVSADPRDDINAQLDAAHNGSAGPDDVFSSVSLDADGSMVVTPQNPVWYLNKLAAEATRAVIVAQAPDNDTEAMSENAPSLPYVYWHPNYPPIVDPTHTDGRPRFIDSRGNAGD